jgi:hypothetical protein
LVFVFAAVALAASALTEAIASLLKLRANTLVSGITKMLNDPKMEGLALDLYRHALVHPQGDGSIKSSAKNWTYSGPSYIKAADFATALVDVLEKTAPGDALKLQQTINDITDQQLKRLLQGMLVRAGGNMDNLRTQVASWFDSTMDRVSGAYKRRAQLVSFLVALVLAMLINVDATHVVAQLWANPTLAAQIAKEVAPLSNKDIEVAKAMQTLKALPVGPDLRGTCDGKELVCLFDLKVTRDNLLGWLITAVASVFGAPFWFDLLQKLVRIRGAGPKPTEPSVTT